jgi:translation initiation factor 1 (eIF-1/SUI1)
LIDINPKEMAKFFKKKFACGCSVDNETNIIEIQGDHSEEVFEILETSFKVPKKQMYVQDEKTKKKVRLDQRGVF